MKIIGVNAVVYEQSPSFSYDEQTKTLTVHDDTTPYAVVDLSKKIVNLSGARRFGHVAVSVDNDEFETQLLMLIEEFLNLGSAYFGLTEGRDTRTKTIDISQIIYLFKNGLNPCYSFMEMGRLLQIKAHESAMRGQSNHSSELSRVVFNRGEVDSEYANPLDITYVCDSEDEAELMEELDFWSAAFKLMSPGVDGDNITTMLSSGLLEKTLYDDPSVESDIETLRDFYTN